MSDIEPQDRRKFSFRDMILIITNIIALVWGAATLSSSVGNLDKSVTNLNITVSKMSDQLQDYGERIRVLEDRSLRKDSFNGSTK